MKLFYWRLLMVMYCIIVLISTGCRIDKANFDFDRYCTDNQEQIIEHFKNTLGIDTAYIEFLGFFKSGDFKRAFPDGSASRSQEGFRAIITKEYDSVHELLNDKYDEDAPYFLVYTSAVFNHSGNSLEEAGISSDDLINYSEGINRRKSQEMHDRVGGYNYNQREYYPILATIIDGKFSFVNNNLQKVGATELEFAVDSLLKPDYNVFTDCFEVPRNKSPMFFKEELEYYADKHFGQSNNKVIWSYATSSQLIKTEIAKTNLKNWFLYNWSYGLVYNNKIKDDYYSLQETLSPADSFLLQQRESFSFWLTKDIDHDYVPDFAELRDGTNLNDSLSFNKDSQLDFLLRCGLSDWDGDGQSNITEIYNGTDFRNPCFLKGIRERSGAYVCNPWTSDGSYAKLDCDCDGLDDADDFDWDNDGIEERYNPNLAHERSQLAISGRPYIYDDTVTIQSNPCNQFAFSNHYKILLPWVIVSNPIAHADSH